MHSAELVHRDIKPANLLLDSNCLVKVCDFGLCRSVGQVQATSSVLTDYVATRWYRAPEILLGSTCYTKAVDIWSVGKYFKANAVVAVIIVRTVFISSFFFDCLL